MPEFSNLPVVDPTMGYDQIFIELLKNLPDELCETLRVGALPHFLDPELAAVLFPADPAGALASVASFPFVTTTAKDRYEYHDSTRLLLLKNWQTDGQERFRKLNASLAKAFLHRMEVTTGGSMKTAVEWVYHSVAADPEAGMRSMTNLFHELLETRELGTADRLLRLVSEQEPWLGDQAAWLQYFRDALAFQRYQEVDMATLDRLARHPVGKVRQAPSDSGIFLSGRIRERSSQGEYVLPNNLLSGCVRRLQGKIALADQHWAEGRKYLEDALLIFKNLENPEEQALTHLELGNRFYAQAIGSGGIQADQPDLDGWMANFLFKFSRLPLLAYRWCAERFDPLPDLYDGSYQNWMVLRMLRLARNHYEAAGKLFKQLGNQRGCLETDFYIGRIMLVLGYPDQCARRCARTLKQPLAASSPYYSARLNLVIAQAHTRHGELKNARKLLEECLDTFTRYGDWRMVLDTTLALGTVLEKQKDWEAMIATAAQGLEAAHNSSDPLAETRIASRLEWYIEMPGISQEQRQAAQKLRYSVTCLAYIDRFPGAVRRTFNNMANWMAYSFIGLFVVLLFSIGFMVQFIEGKLFLQTEAMEVVQGVKAAIFLALPVLVLWAYYIVHLVIGQFVAVYLSFGKVDDSQPETWSVQQDGISRVGELGSGGTEHLLDWQEVAKLVIDNRALYCIPMISASQMHLLPAAGTQHGPEPLVLTASIFRYGSLQSELEKRLPGKVFKNELSILRTHWVWISLITGLAIALAGVLGAYGSPWFTCYGKMQLLASPGNSCDPQFRLYVQPVVQLGLFFASLIFGGITWMRWQQADRKINNLLSH